ncbi:hypothetical protein ACHAXS_000452 [Conticribra weissflogii]
MESDSKRFTHGIFAMTRSNLALHSRTKLSTSMETFHIELKNVSISRFNNFRRFSTLPSIRMSLKLHSSSFVGGLVSSDVSSTRLVFQSNHYP